MNHKMSHRPDCPANNKNEWISMLPPHCICFEQERGAQKHINIQEYLQRPLVYEPHKTHIAPVMPVEKLVSQLLQRVEALEYERDVGIERIKKLEEQVNHPLNGIKSIITVTNELKGKISNIRNTVTALRLLIGMKK